MGELARWRRFGIGARLASVAELVPEGCIVADVGADHGRLLAALLESGRCPRGWIVEINEAPLAAAQQTLLTRGLIDQVELCLGDGFAPLARSSNRSDTATVACLCGVGGTLATKLLSAIPASLETIIFQVNHSHIQLWRALTERGWRPTSLSLVLERSRLFLNLKATRSAASVSESPCMLSSVSPFSSLPRELEVLPLLDLLSSDPLRSLWSALLLQRSEALIAHPSLSEGERADELREVIKRLQTEIKGTPPLAPPPHL